MGHNGSTMYGRMIRKLLHGLNLTVSATYPPHEKGIQPRWSMMSCIYLEGVLKKAPTWAIWRHSESLRGAGTPSKTWVRRLRHDLATA